MNDQLELPPTLHPPKIGGRQVNDSRFAPGSTLKTESPRPLVSAGPSAPAPKVKRSAFEDNEEDEETFFDRHRGKLIIVAILSIGSAMGYFMSLPKNTAVRKAPERVINVVIPPPSLPPPPPPPPPKVQPPPEEKMIEQAPVEEEVKPEPKAEEPPPSLGTGIKGDGPGMSGLGGKGDGSRIGGNGNGNGRGTGRWDGYARQVQSRVGEAMRASAKTRSVSIRGLQIRIWVDATGRITRVKLMGSTGDSAVDAALQNEVLSGLQLREPPPQGMPSPIVLRISARRP